MSLARRSGAPRRDPADDELDQEADELLDALLTGRAAPRAEGATEDLVGSPRARSPAPRCTSRSSTSAHRPAAVGVARQGARGRGHAARRPAEAREEPVRDLAGGAAVARAAARRLLGRPARSLLIAAEDPVDTIVKSRLIAAAADESLVGTACRSPFKAIKTITHQPQEKLDGLDGLDGLGAYDPKDHDPR